MQFSEENKSITWQQPSTKFFLTKQNRLFSAPFLFFSAQMQVCKYLGRQIGLFCHFTTVVLMSKKCLKPCKYFKSICACLYDAYSTYRHFFTYPFILFLAVFVDLLPRGWLEEKCKWFLPLLRQPPQTTPITLLWLQKLLASNSCGETQSFTTALSSILSGFEWIKGKVKQWKAIKRSL